MMSSEAESYKRGIITVLMQKGSLNNGKIREPHFKADFMTAAKTQQ